MANEKNKNSEIETSLIVQTINDAVLSCYGVSGLAEGFEDKKGFVSQGITINRHSDRTLSIDVHLVLVYDVKITEVIREAQNQLDFFLDKKFPGVFKDINVYVDSMI